MHLSGLLRSTIFLIYINFIHFFPFVKLHCSRTAKKKKKINLQILLIRLAALQQKVLLFVLGVHYQLVDLELQQEQAVLKKTTEEEASKVSGGKACRSKSFPWRPQFCIYEFREGQKALLLIGYKRCVRCSKRSAKHHVSNHLIRKAWALATCPNCPFVKCYTPLFFSWALNTPTKEKNWKWTSCFGKTPLFLGHYLQFVTQWSPKTLGTWGSENFSAFKFWTLAHGPWYFLC